MKQRLTELSVEEVTAFIKPAAISARKNQFSEAGWARLVKLQKEDNSRLWQARVGLFRDIEEALGEDPRAGLLDLWLNAGAPAPDEFRTVRKGG